MAMLRLRTSRKALQDLRYVLACLPTHSQAQLLNVVHELEREGFAPQGCAWVKQVIDTRR